MFGLFGSSNFLLFSSRLKQKKAVFFPNKSKKEQSGSTDERNDLVLSNQILDAAKVGAASSLYLGFPGAAGEEGHPHRRGGGEAAAG